MRGMGQNSWVTARKNLKQPKNGPQTVFQGHRLRRRRGGDSGVGDGLLRRIQLIAKLLGPPGARVESALAQELKAHWHQSGGCWDPVNDCYCE